MTAREVSRYSPRTTGRQFAIDDALLADDSAGWRNLGDWRDATQYRVAAENLALKVGRAAALQQGMAVLDLACGQGVSLTCWERNFGVTRLTGLELQTSCIATLRSQAPPSWQIVHGRFDALPLPAPLSADSQDAVVCVDAAYHARSLTALLQVAASALRRGGRFAFTTLALNSLHGNLPFTWRWLLSEANIPSASLLNPPELLNTVNQVGFSNVTIEMLDYAVFAGFARHVRQRELQLSWQQRWSPGWLKIKSTGRLCEALVRTPRLHYVLVSATRL